MIKCAYFSAHFDLKLMKSLILKTAANGSALANLLIQSLFIAVFLLLVTGCAGQAPQLEQQQGISVQTVSSEQSLINKFSHENGDVGVVVLVEKQGVRNEYATGMADSSTSRQANTSDLFEIGSASKMFTAVAIQQLIEAGKFSLDTPIKRFFNSPEYRKLGNFKGKNYWDKITVEMLLNHTSGMIDYLNVYGDDAKALEIFGVRGKDYSVDEIIALATQFGDANFIPGEKFSYSNTGYILLGEIISKVSRVDWHDYIQKNIFDIAGMNDTWFGTRISVTDRKRVMRSSYLGEPTYMPPSLAGSAGEVVSNLDDLGKFMRAWSAGKLYRDATTMQQQLSQSYQQMYPGVDLIKYGYGVMLIDGYYGHGGQTFGFQSYMSINPDKDELYVIAINDAGVSSMDLFVVLAGLSME